jgi:hypothetical protein
MIEDYKFMVQVITDGSTTYSKQFDNAIEAVNCYNSFTDWGFALTEREATLIEPNGKAHSKFFYRPQGASLV